MNHPQHCMILANLTPCDYRRFEDAKISYSGSTGIGSNPESYGGIGPYIATYTGEINRVIAAMDWDEVHIEISGNQWIVRGENKRGREELISRLRRERAELIASLCRNSDELEKVLDEQPVKQ